MSEVKFLKGIYFNAPHENAPDFVKCRISIKPTELCQFLRENKDLINEKGYINMDGKTTKDGKWILMINDFKPGQKQSGNAAPEKPQSGVGSDFDDDVPW